MKPVVRAHVSHETERDLVPDPLPRREAFPHANDETPFLSRVPLSRYFAYRALAEITGVRRFPP